MKKILIIASTVVLLVNSVSFAGTSVDWFANWGYYPHGAADLTSGTPGTGVASSQAVIWQLVYAGANNSIDIVNASNVGGGYVSSDDVVLQTRSVSAGGGAYGEWLYSPEGSLPLFASGTTYTGFFYQRVIGSAVPAIGDWYYNSSTIAAVNWTSGDPDQVLDGNTDGANRGDALNIQIVPEPSSMALLALGLGVIALRRKFRG